MISITREIALDMGHRIQRHESKCKNIHGHRYVIQATLEGPLISDGPETGMVKDFGFLKQYMMAVIHDVYDHKLILETHDPLVDILLGKWQVPAFKVPKELGQVSEVGAPGVMLCLISAPPTAEILAQHWAIELEDAFAEGEGYTEFKLVKLIVFETPNCKVEYIL